MATWLPYDRFFKDLEQKYQEELQGANIIRARTNCEKNYLQIVPGHLNAIIAGTSSFQATRPSYWAVRTTWPWRTWGAQRTPHTQLKLPSNISI
ncbi:hypothetical protein NQ318_002868 [Aromia moschata]|uniref:Uncharacterized protein n=1 Tax=Aromia moschata TaxID=1265417 RepID=A0AAV8Y8S4_9CUCU|nr:hypothetical protein NQ318_002868 [Aromia moschata]